MNQAPAIRTLAALAIATALIFIVAWAYWPGLTGPFLLDDGVNLAPLGDNGGVHDWHRALSFINEGRSGPLHRPVSMASFLANAQDWPADPLPFTATNLLTHFLTPLL